MLPIGVIRSLLRDWRLWARADQLPPDGDWRSWLLLGGRGSGKTRCGAEWVRAIATHEWDEVGMRRAASLWWRRLLMKRGS